MSSAPANIRYPQDISLLNEAREKLEDIIYRMCKSYDLRFHRRDRRRAGKDYLAFAKGRKHTRKQIRAVIRKQLSYVRRDIGYLEGYFSQGCVSDTRDISVSDRIVSISQPWIRHIVRGKVKAPVEFGAKLDVSIDSEGYG